MLETNTEIRVENETQIAACRWGQALPNVLSFAVDGMRGRRRNTSPFLKRLKIVTLEARARATGERAFFGHETARDGRAGGMSSLQTQPERAPIRDSFGKRFTLPLWETCRITTSVDQRKRRRNTAEGSSVG